jgi:hypothetical protein
MPKPYVLSSPAKPQDGLVELPVDDGDGDALVALVVGVA